MSSPNYKLRRRVLTSIQLLILLGVIAILIAETLHYKSLRNVYVADPAKPFDFNVTRENHFWDYVFTSPWTYVLPVLLITLYIVSHYYEKKAWPFESFEFPWRSFWPFVTAAGLTVFSAVSWNFISTDTFEGSLEQWAHDRYGIELEGYPKEQFATPWERDPDTHTTVRLDDGNLIRFVSVVNASGNKSFLITHVGVSDENDGEELPVLDSAK